ncbi:PREDICTED: egg cell-secreted protein 1.4-like [Nelumbo nucifera]|uniref:Egg cell-secreted protein 1.4-like n=2 Tax=Nelumbo nucifera TaxID=4432 RepID=A0A1U7ZQG3_NELNU|nr:PREDICTED: egg cell-secreted protein 1.4-like [Nelumbo nucifera]DAD34387.1 TPA_asm: hypothetical protein HUJ06_005027 [Nelumbo nucifera]
MALNKLAVVLAVWWLMVIGISTAGARQLRLQPGYNLAARLEGGEGGIADCWTALLELRSCTNEIILFFLNGEAYLGLDCCRAIRIITRQCWPSMLNSLGFTAEEGDILRGYCDATASPPTPRVVSPVQSPSGLVLTGMKVMG